jgi:DNA-binding transcriptional LysR family regulator
VEQELGIALAPRIAAAQAIALRRCVVLEQVPPLPRLRWWLMRSRLEPRTPFADIAFTWLRKAASRG